VKNIAVTMFEQLWRRYRDVLVFGIIGVVNTLLHSGMVVLLVERAQVWPVLANVAGFALANTASFFANSYLTFRRRPTLALYWKFLLVSMGSLGLTVLLSGIAELLHWHYLIGLAMVLLCGPVLTYLLHKRFTFRKQTP
jgi:putative flippase GtrA